MKRVVLLPVFLAAVLSLSRAGAADEVGVRSFPVPVPERGGTMAATLWYPAAPGGQPVLVGDSAFFRGVPARQDAPAADGVRPLVLLSHGGLRSGPNIGAWMASRLAARGFIVAMLRQPDPHTQSLQQVLQELWLRPADISSALTAIENDPALSGRIDADRVGVLGFLVGGTAALGLVGARLDPDSLARSCEPPERGVDCAWFAAAGIDLRKIDAGRLARSHLDLRIKAVFIVDPELSTTFSAASLAGISASVRIVNLGDPDTLWPGLDAADAARIIPGARYDTLPDATQYSAFGECKPQAPALLKEEGEEPLCDDVAGRVQIHDRLAAMVEAAFRRDPSR